MSSRRSCSVSGKTISSSTSAQMTAPLISNFQNGGHRILGIEPTDVSKIANERGINTIQRYFLQVRRA